MTPPRTFAASRVTSRVASLVGCLAVVLGGCAAAPPAAAPELVIVNAKVFTADPAQPAAQAVAIAGGRFLAVGGDAQIRALAGPATRVVDAGGRLVTPGLTEAHIHLGQGVPTPPLPLPGLPFPGPTPEQVLAAVAEAAKTRTDWISVYVGPLVPRDTRNWRDALDAVAPATPVFLRGFWGHTSITNSEGLRRMGIAENVADPIGGWWGRDANGRLDGRAYEAAETYGPRIRPATPDRLAASFGEAQQRFARWGVTAIHLMNSDKSVAVTLAGLKLTPPLQKWTVYSWGVWGNGNNAIARIADAGTVLDAVVGQAPPKVRVEGPKWVLDGTPIEQGSLQEAPYRGRPGWRGRSDFTDAQLREILQMALERPTQSSFHLVGDAETVRVLNAMEQLAPAAAWRAQRVRIEHGDGLRGETLAQAARLGLVVVQNPLHLEEPTLPGGGLLLDSHALLRSLPAAGVPLAFGSDGGLREANPFLNMMLAVTYAAEPSEALTREQALTAYTAGAAFAERQESKRGRIAPGLAADLAILSHDVLTVPLPRLPATTSLMTLVDGVVIFEDAPFK